MSGHVFIQHQLAQRRNSPTFSAPAEKLPKASHHGHHKSSSKKHDKSRKSSKKHSSSVGKPAGLEMLLMAIQKQDEPAPQLRPMHFYGQCEVAPMLPSIASLGLDRLCSPMPLQSLSYMPLHDQLTLQMGPQMEMTPEREFCYQCGTTETPKWRRGFAADGHSSVRLCNACGIRSKRVWTRKAPATAKFTTNLAPRKLSPSASPNLSAIRLMEIHRRQFCPPPLLPAPSPSSLFASGGTGSKHSPSPSPPSFLSSPSPPSFLSSETMLPAVSSESREFDAKRSFSSSTLLF